MAEFNINNLDERSIRELRRMREQLASLQARPKRIRRSYRRRTGGGGTFRVAVGKAIATIPVAVDSGSSRTPGKGDVTIVKSSGDAPATDWENWSTTVEITTDSYLVAVDIDGDMVIVSMFC